MPARHRLPRIIKLGKHTKYIIERLDTVDGKEKWRANGYVLGKKTHIVDFDSEAAAVAWAQAKKM